MMRKFTLTQTEVTPEINFDFAEQKLSIKGVCAPENSKDFFTPILQHLREYKNMHQELLVEFNFDYFNTGSSKCLLDLLYTIKPQNSTTFNPKVNWYLADDDDEMKESAQIFEELTGLKFNYIVCN